MKEVWIGSDNIWFYPSPRLQIRSVPKRLEPRECKSSIGAESVDGRAWGSAGRHNHVTTVCVAERTWYDAVNCL